MLTKLAFKNAGKSVRDYAVYFFTLVLGVSVFYMFNSIYAQKDIMVVTETQNDSMVALCQLLSIISVFVAVVLGFLIVYANNFFIKRRKKELGIYMTLGMEKSKISVILVLETLVMAIAALLLGLVVGIFGSQFMSVFTASIFEADMSGFRFVFSVDALVKSVLYFAIIFVVVILFNIGAINRYKLIDLIYGGRKNEELKVRNIWVSIAIFCVSLIFLAAAYYLILKNGMVNINALFFSSIGLGTMGTLLFFFSVSGILIKLIQSRKNVYYKNLNMFVTKQLSSKINTNFVSISVVCIVLLLVIGIFSCGYSVQNSFSAQLRENIIYDFSLYGDSSFETTIYESLPEDVKQQDITWQEYSIYNSGEKLHYSDFPLDFSSSFIDMSEESLSIMLLSDYNKMLEMQQKQGIALGEEEYLILAPNELFQDTARQFCEKNISLPLFDGVTLKPTDNTVSRITTANQGFGGIYFVVSDCYKQQIKELSDTSNQILNINCKSDEQASQVKVSLEKQNDNNKGYYYFDSKQGIYENSVGTKAIVSFLAIYLGIVFMISCAAILAIQQLSEAADNKSRYELLHKLGTDKNMIYKALFKQILCYFLMPLLLAVVHSVVGITAANEVIKIFGRIDVTKNIIVTACVIIGVYGAYFGLTYMGSKSIISK
ncbi:FtsX-like permease family protein [Anaerotignum sp.]|uniref:FtsX-like permease family protein n=1 Tax=Anaerotignum sp. TaxID=2039241 RepID=UPI00271476C1|nr:ABC transporter permease [Anaerotignum sp.]